MCLQVIPVGNFVAFRHIDWEPPLIGEVLKDKEEHVTIHWWAQGLYRTWKACYREESAPWTEEIAKSDIVHVFTMKQNGTFIKMPITLIKQ